MLPFYDVQLLCFGAAAVIDTALVLVVFERRNWRRVIMPIVVLLLGAWLYHTGTFVHTLLQDTPGDTATFLHWATMVVIATGLLLLPSAMLHSLLRLRSTGFAVASPREWRYLWCYLPLAGILPVGILLMGDPRGQFMQLVAPLVIPYTAWLVAVNLACAVGFFKLRRSATVYGAQSFLAILAVILILLAAMHALIILIAMPAWPHLHAYLQLALAISPLAIVLLFAYYILRYSFMQLALERTIVYGIILLGAVVAHRFVFRNFHAAWDQRFRFDFAFVEATLLIGLILAYRPLRQRTGEALRYFMGERFERLRRRVRQAALDMSSLAGRPPGEIIAWFEATLKDVFDVRFTSITLLDAGHEESGNAPSHLQHLKSNARPLLDAMANQHINACTRQDAPAGVIDDTLRQTEILLLVALNHPGMAGLIALGPRTSNRSFSHEQINMVILLVEQLGITLTTSRLQADRLAAERRALQNEKLSTIGLVTGSIAHEVKNPLSSIKTIATVLAEDLGEGSPHAEDLRLILSEIERLSATVTQLLQFARPSPGVDSTGSMVEAVRGTLRLMRHVAKERGVTLTELLPPSLPDVNVNDNVLREIAFNLISNAIEAAGDGGTVDVKVLGEAAHVQLHVTDNGPGLTPEVQDRLFEPFVTSKSEGTGLGLYVVGRHVREAGGEIRCETRKGEGTRFFVRLPCVAML